MSIATITHTTINSTDIDAVLAAMPDLPTIPETLINILKVIWSSDKQPSKDSEAAKEPA